MPDVTPPFRSSMSDEEIAEWYSRSVGSYVSGSTAAASYVTSIQQVTITIAATATTGTATITAVDTAKAAIIWQGSNCNTENVFADTGMVRLELTDATTVTAYRQTAHATMTMTVQAVILEGTASLLTSVQHGTITIGAAATSNTATISSVNTSTSVVVWLGETTTSTNVNAPENYTTRFSLTNATTVTANRAGSTDSVTVGYCVVEFAPGAVTSVQRRSVTFNDANTTNTDTISSVDTSNSVLLTAGTTLNDVGASLGFKHKLSRFALTASTTTTWVDIEAFSMSRTENYAVVCFTSGVLRSLQAGTRSLSLATQGDATISSVDTSKAICVYAGVECPSGGNANFGRNLCMVKLNSATAVRANRGNATGTAIVGYQVLEFTA